MLKPTDSIHENLNGYRLNFRVYDTVFILRFVRVFTNILNITSDFIYILQRFESQKISGISLIQSARAVCAVTLQLSRVGVPLTTKGTTCLSQTVYLLSVELSHRYGPYENDTTPLRRHTCRYIFGIIMRETMSSSSDEGNGVLFLYIHLGNKRKIYQRLNRIHLIHIAYVMLHKMQTLSAKSCLEHSANL